MYFVNVLIKLNKKSRFKMSGWTKTAFILANIGAVNWGLEQFNWNVVDLLGGAATVVYYIIAISGLYGLYAILKK